MKKTTRPRKRQQSSVLQVRVMSPRIAWFGFLKVLGRCAKYAVILALVGGAVWGGWRGIRHAFHENPDFLLRKIDLNENSAIDGIGVVRIAGIDPQANLFALDIGDITARLSKVPALSDVKVERQLPGTLSIRVTARTPYAWIASPEEGIPAERKTGALMIDLSRQAFPCTEYQLITARELPVVILSKSDAHAIASGRAIVHPELARCLRLLGAIERIDPTALAAVESVRQANDWSLELVTRAGVTATFGLGDHERQIANFRSALDHAARKNYLIDTINLIPRENVPVTLRGEAPAPKAVVVPEPTPDEIRKDRRARDLDTLLNRR